MKKTERGIFKEMDRQKDKETEKYQVIDRKNTER
jgi:hypothetical protein